MKDCTRTTRAVSPLGREYWLVDARSQIGIWVLQKECSTKTQAKLEETRYHQTKSDRK